MENTNALIQMIISEALILITFIVIFFTQRKKSQLKISFLTFITLVFIWILGSILQICFSNTNIDPFLFEKFAGFGVVFSPVAFFTLCMVFAKTKIRLQRKHLLLLIIPIISTILFLTNEHHHLMFEHYSTNNNEVVFGTFFTIHSLYSYGLYFIGMFYLLRYSIKNSGFFSKQSLLLFLGTSIPLVANLLGTLKIIEISTYTTPIAFAFTAIFYAFAIFKFKFISTAPIALQKIVDRISDSYVVLDEDYNITDFNKTFLNTFSFDKDYIRGKNFFKLSDKNTNFKINDETFKNSLEKIKNSKETINFEQEITTIAKTFSVEINNIFTDKSFLGILILFKDITQHEKDMETIKNNQDMLIEQERLASLGQMIGRNCS